MKSTSRYEKDLNQKTLTADERAAKFWPRLIIGFFAVVFMANAIFIYLALTHSSSLVTENYYEKSLLHDEKIQRLQLAEKLGFEVSLRKKSRHFELLIAQSSLKRPGLTEKQLKDKGWKLEFYRPENPALDQIIELHQMADLDSMGHDQKIKRWWTSDLDLKPGRWEIVLKYKVDGEIGEEKFVHWENDPA